MLARVGRWSPPRCGQRQFALCLKDVTQDCGIKDDALRRAAQYCRIESRMLITIISPTAPTPKLPSHPATREPTCTLMPVSLNPTGTPLLTSEYIAAS